MNYANNPNEFGKAFQSEANKYAYTNACVDIEQFAGKKLRIVLPYSASFGLAFSTVNDIWNKETKQDGWYCLNTDSTQSETVVEIVIPAGAKYVKTTYYLDSYKLEHPEVMPFSAVIVD